MSENNDPEHIKKITLNVKSNPGSAAKKIQLSFPKKSEDQGKKESKPFPMKTRRKPMGIRTKNQPTARKILTADSDQTVAMSQDEFMLTVDNDQTIAVPQDEFLPQEILKAKHNKLGKPETRMPMPVEDDSILLPLTKAEKFIKKTNAAPATKRKVPEQTEDDTMILPLDDFQPKKQKLLEKMDQFAITKRRKHNPLVKPSRLKESAVKTRKLKPIMPQSLQQQNLNKLSETTILKETKGPGQSRKDNMESTQVKKQEEETKKYRSTQSNKSIESEKSSSSGSLMHLVEMENELIYLFKMMQSMLEDCITILVDLTGGLDCGPYFSKAMDTLQKELKKNRDQDETYWLLWDLLSKPIMETVRDSVKKKDWSELSLYRGDVLLLGQDPCKLFFFFFRLLSLVLYHFKQEIEKEVKVMFAKELLRLIKELPDFYLRGKRISCELEKIFQYCRKNVLEKNYYPDSCIKNRCSRYKNND